MRERSIELCVFGDVQLTAADGTELRAVLTQPKRLALLAYLALEWPGSFHRRDSLLALFWPDFTAARARAALRRALHFVRHALGADVLVGRGEEEVGLDVARFACDAVHFEQLLDAGALDAALALDSGFVSALYMRMGIAERDRDLRTEARLRPLLRRNAGRATDWDRITVAASTAYFDGDADGAEALARTLVERFPRDPRAYGVLAHYLDEHGRWNEYEPVARRVVALEALAPLDSGAACGLCTGYAALATAQLQLGDLAQAERSYRRWLVQQPDNRVAPYWLAGVLVVRGRADEAIAVARQAESLARRSGARGSDLLESTGRATEILIMARRHAAADSAIRLLVRDTSSSVRALGLDLRMMLERERGQFRRARRTIEEANALTQGDFIPLLRADILARTGDTASARRVFETAAHAGQPDGTRLPRGQEARAFAWPHALLADALGAAADTTWLHALADSLERIGTQSYYGRDWRLHHHVRSLIARRGGRWAEAAREFDQARFGALGWSRTVAELADAQLALGHANEAIATLRVAYVPGPAAMGRYLPQSEIDYRMALAFRRAGLTDSAAVYAAYVRRAWAEADPDVRSQLAGLDGAGLGRRF